MNRWFYGTIESRQTTSTICDKVSFTCTSILLRTSFTGRANLLDVIKESIFFAERAHSGSIFIFDDYPKYDMQSILNVIVNQYGFGLLKQGKNKISLKKV